MIYNRALREKLSDSWMNNADTAHMTDREVAWKKKITSILLNKSGKWGLYQHALYAKRFQDFILKIVPLSVDPEFTAAVDWEAGVIYVGEGFLVDDSKCYQLNVIIRHELAHVLLRHQIRMMHEIGELPYSHVKTSESVHDLLNTIADFEISNRKYTTEDKEIIRNLYLNGQIIKGLITEDHRDKWIKMPIEEMYHELLRELAKISSDINNQTDLSRIGFTDTGRKLRQKDMITSKGYDALRLYTDKVSPSVIWGPIEEYVARSKQFSKVAKEWQELVHQVYAELDEASEDELNDALNKVAKSNPVEEISIGDVKVYTPEEKYWAVQVIKALLGNCRPRPKLKISKATHSPGYVKAYNTIIRSCGSKTKCPDEQLKEIAEAISALAGM